MAKLVRLTDSSGNIFPQAFSASGLTSSDDLDNVRYPAMAFCNSVVNKPTGSGTYGWIFNPYTNVQIYFDYRSYVIAALYVRVYINDVWSAWRKIDTVAI